MLPAREAQPAGGSSSSGQQQQDVSPLLQEQARQAQQQRAQPKTFAELLAVDAEARAEQAAARGGSGITPADRAQAVDTTGGEPGSSLLAGELAAAEAAAAAEGSYGVFQGIAIDDTYRPTFEDGLREQAPFQR